MRYDLRGPSRVNQSAVNSSKEKLVREQYSDQIQVNRAYQSVEEQGVVD